MNKVDWVGAFDTEGREAFLDALTQLPFEQLRTQPLPKRVGLPFGFEPSIFIRHLQGKSCHFQQSGLARLYRMQLSQRERDTYDGFVLGKPLSRQKWYELIGHDQVAKWMERDLMSDGLSNTLLCNFRVVSIGSVTLITDPFDVRFSNRVHTGGDSVSIVEFLEQRPLRRTGRLLDVGTGSGVVLLHCSSLGAYDEVVGVDINPRAVVLAGLNAEWNGCSCNVAEIDIFGSNNHLGKFDLITWNVPFRFFPESFKAQNVDGYGGRMGIEISLKFVDALPSLLAEHGEAYLYTSGPVLFDGRRMLDEELEKRASLLNLDISIMVQRCMWDTQLHGFHEQFQVARFEVCVVRLIRGRGIVERFEPSLHERTLNGARWVLHHVRKMGLLKARSRPPNAE